MNYHKGFLNCGTTCNRVCYISVLFFNNAELGYVISENYENADSKGKYNPEKMFSCLADSVILMLGGKIK